MFVALRISSFWIWNDDNIRRNSKVEHFRLLPYILDIKQTMVSPVQSVEVAYMRLGLQPHFGFGTTSVSVTICESYLYFRFSTAIFYIRQKVVHKYAIVLQSAVNEAAFEVN